ncbi:type II toxin-antitoxin system RelE/ParE family toxin [Bacteroides stercorirosoris]|jgi:phage-related protein|uniref:Phage-related protein n=1 Tax=Bacteroides stercorirosoris TaxID=871324 RepID=A0A1M6H7L3_9BACE|nr:type II toxin-antitoxin system RelE/ParE family toxin [Bacteroides stercorirosoris]SHJ18180.1 Phage-related protein [Bacteroides stercorirosoris]
MEYKREIIVHGDYFAEFYDKQVSSVRQKINYVLNLLRVEEHIPSRFFRNIENVRGLFEIRIEMESNIFRIFCCFDEGKLVVLFNGFQKKTQKTPLKEIEKATSIMKEYFDLKKKGNRL